jgi:hypothetical protein
VLRADPLRCAITVTGIVGSWPAAPGPELDRIDHRTLRRPRVLRRTHWTNARCTAFLEIPRSREIAVIAIPPTCAADGSPPSPPLSSPSTLSRRGPFSAVDQRSVFTRRRQSWTRTTPRPRLRCRSGPAMGLKICETRGVWVAGVVPSAVSSGRSRTPRRCRRRSCRARSH